MTERAVRGNVFSALRKKAKEVVEVVEEESAEVVFSSKELDVVMPETWGDVSDDEQFFEDDGFVTPSVTSPSRYPPMKQVDKPVVQYEPESDDTDTEEDEPIEEVSQAIEVSVSNPVKKKLDMAEFDKLLDEVALTNEPESHSDDDIAEVDAAESLKAKLEAEAIAFLCLPTEVSKKKKRNKKKKASKPAVVDSVIDDAVIVDTVVGDDYVDIKKVMAARAAKKEVKKTDATKMVEAESKARIEKSKGKKKKDKSGFNQTPMW